MAEITLTIPDAWVSEDGGLFVMPTPYSFNTKMIERGNRALEECGYDERITIGSWLSRRAVVYIDPAYIAAERWPASVVSTKPVDGWVRIFRIDIGDLESSDSGTRTTAVNPTEETTMTETCSICGERSNDLTRGSDRTTACADCMAEADRQTVDSGTEATS